jgi:hypothetical protein
MVGVVVLLAGGALLGTSIAASAASPTLTVHPTTVASSSLTTLKLNGTGYPKKSTGIAFVCPVVPGEPTVTFGSYGTFPVGCGTYYLYTDPTGAILPGKSQILLTSGQVIANWSANQTDSTGGNADTDAANYPVPPYQGQTGSVVVYAVIVSNSTPYEASYTLGFGFSTPSTAAPTTTTTAPCDAVSKSADAYAGKGKMTVDPATCLVDGSVVKVSATGMTAGSLGSILECNSNSSQPTISYLGNAIPVSCSAVHIITVGDTGVYAANFTVGAGTVGPPTAGTDSAGNSAAADAAKYPCPPTAAQVSAGDTCVIAIADLAGDKIKVPIAFDTGKLGTTTTTTTAAKTTATTSSATTTASTTAVSSSKLAFTGTGAGVLWLALIGIALMLLGGLMLLLAGPRLVFAKAAHSSGRVIRRRDS